MIGLYIAANVGKYLFRSSAKYGYTGIIGGGLASGLGRGAGRLVGKKYAKVGEAIYDFFNEGGIGHSLLAGSKKVDKVGDLASPAYKKNWASNIESMIDSEELGIDQSFRDLLGRAINAAGGKAKKLTISEHRKISRTLRNAEIKYGSDLSTKMSAIGMHGGKVLADYESIARYSRAVVSQHNKRFVKAGLVTVGSAYIASLTSRKAFEAMQAVESNALNFAASIGEYEAVRAIPMMNTMQATTERAAALQYIQQSRTNARSLLGQEAALRHGV